MNGAIHPLGLSLLLASSLNSATASFSTDLVGYWNFNETSGSIPHDSSAYSNNGSLINGGTWANGRIGGAISFNGINQYLNVPDFPKPTTSFTISTWFYAKSASLWAPIAANWGSTYGDFTLSFFSNQGFLSMYVADRRVSGGVEVIPATEYGLGIAGISDPAISLGSWHHVAVVANADTDTIQFWRDGQAMASVGYSGTFITPPVANLTIGGRPSSGRYWDGLIDDLAIWNRPLNQSDVNTIYRNGLAGISPVPEPSLTALCAIGFLLLNLQPTRKAATN